MTRVFKVISQSHCNTSRFIIYVSHGIQKFHMFHMGIYLYFTCYLMGFTRVSHRKVPWVAHGNIRVFHMGIYHVFRMGIYMYFTCDLLGFTWDSHVIPWVSNQIKSLLLSHHHSTSALVSEILESVLQTVQKKTNKQNNLHIDSTYLQTVQKTMCKIHIHILNTHSVL